MKFYRTDRWLGRSLDLYGEWSEGETDLFRRIVQPGAWVVEAGANVGALTLPLAQIVAEKGRVIALEPQSSMAELLAVNCRGYDQIQILQVAAGAESGQLTVPIADYTKAICNPGGYELAPVDGLESDGASEDVEIISIDGLELPRLDFLKADVEGHELAVVLGAAETIKKHRPILYLEDDRAENSAALRRCVGALGYRMYAHHPPLYNPNNMRKYRVNVFANTVSVNLLCIPQERHDLKHLTDLLERIRG